MKQDMLQAVIEQLDFSNGQLFSTVEVSRGSLSRKDWLDKGDWLLSAQKAGVEYIFFVENNPVAVFARSKKSDEEKIAVFNKIWCLARPRLLFLESEGELSVIDLAQAPIRQEWNVDKQKLTALEILTSVEKVARKLQKYHRDNIETGKVFEHGRFGDLKHRADQALIADLRTVRGELMQAGLHGPKMQYAHALIGRSIFIRYLEDRGILTEEYFSKVAGSNPTWQTLLQNPYSRDQMDFSGVKAKYPRVLQDKDFTYALFRMLSIDFNGDMFPDIDEEEKNIEGRHLQLIQELLYGDVGSQKKLFFYSYKFDIIPLDLISAIYEEFYHASASANEKKSKARQDGAYYTPPALAEFVLSRILTDEVLQKNPRILDPACGSGIFLVEAFRRVVRYRLYQKKSSLHFSELKEILGRQIAGIEVNEEAARITAFSLYLAMLHYLDPPSIFEHILNGDKLPNLIMSANELDNHYNSIHVANAFALDNKNVGEIDVVVGNPPWGAPNNPSKGAKDRQRIMLDWCKKRKYPIGDNEPSQAFLWRSLDFLNKEGRCALLTSAGVLFNHSSTTQTFRREWMSRVCITEVFNFSHVRKFFFKGADSPFVMIHFKNGEQGKTPVEYWSLKQVASLKETQAILLSKYDRAYLTGQDLTDNKTWKANWFGRHADTVFFHQFHNFKTLLDHIDRRFSGQGISPNPPQKATDDLPRNLLVQSSFSRFNDSLQFKNLPLRVYRLGKIETYTGPRLLIKRGISEKGETKGTVVARYESKNFCFTNAINGIKLINNEETQYLLFLGILWSSFSRYFYFNISANWGLWHHEIHLDDELLQLPIPSRLRGKEANHVVSIVKKLRNYQPQVQDVLYPDGVPQNEIELQRRKWEAELDEAVFDLYGFTKEQQDLIRDCCEVTLPFFYQPYNSVGAMPGVKGSDTSWIKHYAERFARRWQPYLNQDEILRADLHIGASGNMVAIEFYPADLGDEWNLSPKTDSWGHVLEEISKSLPRPMGTSQILLDGIVHIVTDNSIIVIKRNEKRFWTRSLAYEDAESTLAKRMLETMPEKSGVE
ncbi:MAG: N-6 DNA methylase [Deltaproteobacteria bacterium]|nr:N-6 DNA methylase [Deltaproteobacteria bacterium]